MDVVVPAFGRPRRVDSELRLANEGEEFRDLGDLAEILLDSIQGRRDRSPLAVEDPEGLSEGVDRGGRSPDRLSPTRFSPVTQL